MQSIVEPALELFEKSRPLEGVAFIQELVRFFPGKPQLLKHFAYRVPAAVNAIIAAAPRPLNALMSSVARVGSGALEAGLQPG